jgi:hypothetical protein
MKALIFTLGLLMASTAAVAERDGGEHRGPGADKKARMQQELGLSEEQMEQIREIRAQGGSRDDIHAILTEEQQAKAMALRETHEAKRAQRMVQMQERLELSDEQIAQIDDIRAQGGSREDVQAVLTDEQKSKAKEWRQSHGKGDGPH